MSFSTEHKVPQRLLLAYRLWAIASGCLLFFLVLRSPSELKYDEVYHIGLAKLIDEHGFVVGLNSEQNQSAAGPLFAVIHLSMKFATSFTPPAIRFINLFILAATLLVTWLTLKGRCSFPIEATLSLLAIPFLWPTVGLALTEIPALFCFTCFTLLMHWMLQSHSQKAITLLAMGAGTFLGLSVAGRQTYLVSIPALVLFAGSFPRWRLATACILLFALFICIWPFILWRGLVPPSQAHTSEGIVVQHGLLGLAYMGAASVILNPRHFFVSSKKWILPIAVLSLPVTLLFLNDMSPPGQSTLTRMVPETLLGYVQFITKASLAAVGLLWGATSLDHLFQNRKNPTTVLDTLLTLVMAAAPAKVSHLFSSRYIVSGLTCECNRISSEFRPSYVHLALLIASTLFGATSLIAYYES